MKNNRLNYQKIGIKLANKKNKVLGFISIDDSIALEKVGLEIAKEVAKLLKTVYINFTRLDKYEIGNLDDMIKKDEELSLINISLKGDIVKLVNSSSFISLMEDLKDRFDLILINEQEDPILSYLLTTYDEGKILFAKENKTRKSKFMRKYYELEKLSSPIVGVVYNS